eukprot:5171634-Amphidinium_carterae.2
MNTAKRICAGARRLGNKVTWSRLKVPKIVSGVGSGAAVAEFQVSVEGLIDAQVTNQGAGNSPSKMRLVYTAPVVGG